MWCLGECEEDFAVFTNPPAGSVIFEDRTDTMASDASPEESAVQSVADTQGVGNTGDISTQGADINQDDTVRKAAASLRTTWILSPRRC